MALKVWEDFTICYHMLCRTPLNLVSIIMMGFINNECCSMTAYNAKRCLAIFVKKDKARHSAFFH